MELLKRLPISYTGELHNVRLINFSVPLSDVKSLVPAQIKIRTIGGRAIISMVNVELKNMRASVFPFISFNYDHFAFRLLVDDGELNNGKRKGIYFLKSFTDKNWVEKGGSIFTNYKLELANIEYNPSGLELTQDTKFVKYKISNEELPDDELLKVIGKLDRAYSLVDDRLYSVKIMREKWPLKKLVCIDFETNFFKDAQFESAYKVTEVIYYKWNPPVKV